MWHDSRSGRNLIRKRNNDRKDKEILTNLSIALVTTLGICVIIILGIKYIAKIDKKELEVANNPSTPVGEDDVEIYSEIDNTATSETVDKKFTFVALGELMLGGVGENYSYISAFKNVSEYTKNANYTVANLTTNIVDLEKIIDPTSKYIVTKDIFKSFSVLGIDGVNIASDHMLDFDKNIFDGTKSLLLKNDIDVIGLSSEIVYAENDGIKVAFIGINNEVIGMYSRYIDAGIRMYDNYMISIKNIIAEAKTRADTVIVMTHLGSENTHKVMSVMSWFYREIINSGADAVLGAHSLGIYPIEIYMGKPIIYSLGYLVHDTYYEVGKKSAIFKFTIDVNGDIEKIEVLPTYIDKNREVILYSEYDLKDTISFLNYIKPEGVSGSIENNILTVNIKNK